MITKKGNGIIVAKGVQYNQSLTVGHGSIIGTPGERAANCVFGTNVVIGKFCIVEDEVLVGDFFSMDDYCALYRGAQVGDRVKLLYGKKIYGRAMVGNDCIVGGNVPERCILRDRVTFMGEVAHSHYDPTRDWDSTDEPSPTIGTGSVIGVNSIIVGGVSIGENCYVSAGEILRHDLAPGSVFLKGKIHTLSSFRGLIKTRF